MSTPGGQLYKKEVKKKVTIATIGAVVSLVIALIVVFNKSWIQTTGGQVVAGLAGAAFLAFMVMLFTAA